DVAATVARLLMSVASVPVVVARTTPPTPIVIVPVTAVEPLSNRVPVEPILVPPVVRLPPAWISTVLPPPIASAVPALAAPLICAVPPFSTFVVAVAPVGTPLSQLPEVNQSPVAPVQLVVCARAGVTTAPTANNTANARTLPSDARITSPPVCRQRRCPSTLPPRVPTARMRCEFMTASPRAREPQYLRCRAIPSCRHRNGRRAWPFAAS